VLFHALGILLLMVEYSAIQFILLFNLLNKSSDVIHRLFSGFYIYVIVLMPGADHCVYSSGLFVCVMAALPNIC
jgi:hypothetical protein